MRNVAIIFTLFIIVTSMNLPAYGETQVISAQDIIKFESAKEALGSGHPVLQLAAIVTMTVIMQKYGSPYIHDSIQSWFEDQKTKPTMYEMMQEAIKRTDSHQEVTQHDINNAKVLMHDEHTPDWLKQQLKDNIEEFEWFKANNPDKPYFDIKTSTTVEDNLKQVIIENYGKQITQAQIFTLGQTFFGIDGSEDEPESHTPDFSKNPPVVIKTDPNDALLPDIVGYDQYGNAIVDLSTLPRYVEFQLDYPEPPYDIGRSLYFENLILKTHPAIQENIGDDVPNSLAGAWLDNIPWDLCDGAGGCPNEEEIKEDSPYDGLNGVDIVIQRDPTTGEIINPYIPPHDPSTPEPAKPEPNDPDGLPGTGIPGIFNPPTIEVDSPEPDVDPQPPGEKSSGDPFGRHEDGNIMDKWLVPLRNGIDCESMGVERGQYDNDKWLECPSYGFAPTVEVLVNNPVIGEPLAWYNLIDINVQPYPDMIVSDKNGSTFGWKWMDLNGNMRIDATDSLVKETCTLVNTNVWGFQEYQPNGNLSTGLYYCNESQENYNSFDIVYFTHGE